MAFSPYEIQWYATVTRLPETRLWKLNISHEH